MPAFGALFALLLVLSIAGTVGLWYAIGSETDGNPRMDRADAERAARKDTTEERADDPPESEEWGREGSWGHDEREGDGD